MKKTMGNTGANRRLAMAKADLRVKREVAGFFVFIRCIRQICQSQGMVLVPIANHARMASEK
jgi:hypothetical protein